MEYRDDDDRGRRYRGEGYYGGYYSGGERERDWREPERRDYERRRGGEEPGFLERLSEELRALFRSREDRDPRRGDDRGWGGPSRAWGAGGRDEEIDRDWARQWGHVEGRGRAAREPEWSRGRDWGFRGEGVGGRRGESTFWGDPSAWGSERGGFGGGESAGERGGWRGAEPGGERGFGRRGDMFGGPHAGRGPRGYTRSDERIREDVCDRLCQHGFLDASDIEVRVVGGEVTLIGFVRERPDKRVAEDAAEQVPGVREVSNQLRVKQGGQLGGDQPSGDQPGGEPQGGRPFRAA